MVQLITTYRYDYSPPITNRYKFQEKTGKEHSEACNCDKPENVKECSSGTMPESKKTHLKMEWTGIAPMGRIIEPKILPPDSDGHLGRSQQKTPSECIEDQPNRFLKVLKKCYPDLYEHIKQMPDNDLKRRLNIERLKTTYQIDYCKMQEFPEGIYHQKIVEDDNEKNKKMDMIGDGCEQFKREMQTKLNNEGDKCEVRSFRHKKSDLEPTIKDYSSHSVDTKPITEYIDKVSRTGCIIMKNNIHDHRNCRNGKKCVHDLKTQCRDFK